jgi:hypothetical protein
VGGAAVAGRLGRKTYHGDAKLHVNDARMTAIPTTETSDPPRRDYNGLSEFPTTQCGQTGEPSRKAGKLLAETCLSKGGRPAKTGNTKSPVSVELSDPGHLQKTVIRLVVTGALVQNSNITWKLKIKPRTRRSRVWVGPS